MYLDATVKNAAVKHFVEDVRQYQFIGFHLAEARLDLRPVPFSLIDAEVGLPIQSWDRSPQHLPDKLGRCQLLVGQLLEGSEEIAEFEESSSKHYNYE